MQRVLGRPARRAPPGRSHGGRERGRPRCGPETGEAQLVEAGDLGGGEGLVAQPVQGRAARSAIAASSACAARADRRGPRAACPPPVRRSKRSASTARGRPAQRVAAAVPRPRPRRRRARSRETTTCSALAGLAGSRSPQSASMALSAATGRRVARAAGRGGAAADRPRRRSGRRDPALPQAPGSGTARTSPREPAPRDADVADCRRSESPTGGRRRFAALNGAKAPGPTPRGQQLREPFAREREPADPFELLAERRVDRGPAGGAAATAAMISRAASSCRASTLSGAVANGGGAALERSGCRTRPPAGRRAVAVPPQAAVGIEAVERQQLPAFVGEQVDGVDDVLEDRLADEVVEGQPGEARAWRPGGPCATSASMRCDHCSSIGYMRWM